MTTDGYVVVVVTNAAESDRDQQLDAAALSRFTKTQLLAICEVVGEPVAISASRTEIVVTILRAAGYKARKSPPQAPPPRQITLEQLDHLLYTYLQDEHMLLKAVANALNDLILMRDLNTPKDDSGFPLSVPHSVLKDRLEKTLEELRYYTGHSSIRHIANLYRLVNPGAKLDL